MITALISLIVGVILTFNEKTHLLKKPITLAKGAIIVLLLFSACFSFWKDQGDSTQRKNDSGKIDSLNTRSKVLNEQIDYLRKESKVAQKEYEDSLVSYHNYTTDLLAKYGLKVDTLSNTIKKYDTSIKRGTPPILELDPGREIIFLGIVADKYKFKVNFKSAEAGSTNFNVTLYLVSKYDDEFMEYNGQWSPLPKAFRMEANSSWGAAFNSHKPFKYLYIWIQGTYTDIRNTETLPVSQVYRFSFDTKQAIVEIRNAQMIKDFVNKSDKSKKILIEDN